MAENRVAIVFSDEERTVIREAVKVLETRLLPKLIKINADERQELPKMGDKKVAFVTKTSEYATNNPSMVPNFVDLQELQRDIAIVQELRTILGPIKTLTDSISDTMLVAGSEAYSGALAIYGSVKFAARLNQPGAEVIFNELKRQFPRSASKETVPAATTAAVN